MLKLIVHAQRDKGRSRFGLSPHTILAVGRPGSAAMLTAPGSHEVVAGNLEDKTGIAKYPVGHFDLYTGEWFETAAVDQINFINSVLGLAERFMVSAYQVFYFLSGYLVFVRLSSESS